MYKLSVDFTKCEGCMQCEVLLPGFRNVHGGLLLVSKSRIEEEDVLAAARSIVDGCKNSAISIEPYGGAGRSQFNLKNKGWWRQKGV